MSAFREVTDAMTGGCGCACHTGIGHRTACEHCANARQAHTEGQQVASPEQEALRVRVAMLEGAIRDYFHAQQGCEYLCTDEDWEAAPAAETAAWAHLHELVDARGDRADADG